MTRALALSARQITAICKGAAKAGFVAEIVVNGMVVRLVPENSAVANLDDELDAELKSWDDTAPSWGRQESRRQTSSGTHRSGQIDKAVQDYYDKLGFDPRTMGDADLRRLHEAAEERWKASIPGTPLQIRERKALGQLSAYGVNVRVPWHEIKGCGIDTTERLQARGFVETTPHPKHPENVEFLILTEAGHREAAKLSP